MDMMKTYLIIGVVLFGVLSVTCKLLPPTIVANDDEFILEKNSVFNISCTGKKKVAWVEPLPDNTFVYPGYYTATLFIYNASGAHTRYYTCRYQTIDAETAANHEDENETEIHVFVPDPELPFVPEVPENMVIPLFPEGTVIPCRVSDPMSEVILKSVPSGVQVSAPYENKIGFIAELSSGQYTCETTSAKGVTTASVNYTVVDTKEMKDFHVEVKASEESVRVGEAFNITCVAPTGLAYMQQWLHPRKQAVDAVQMRQTLPDRVVYTLSIPRASAQDSGLYECSVTNKDTREIRANRVAITVFGT